MGRKKALQKCMAIMLSVVMVVGLTPISVMAETGGPTVSESDKIISFEELAPEISAQSVPLGTSKSKLNLPETLTAEVCLAPAVKAEEPKQEEQVQDSGEADASLSIIMNVPVTWTASPEYDSGTADKYIFTPALPEGFALAEGVSAPKITVTVQAQQGPAALTGQMQLLAVGGPIDISGKDIYTIQSEITAALSVNDTVTVTGSKTGFTQALQLTIPEEKTVVWQAEYAGDISRLISINGGGYFVVGGDATITNTGASGTAIFAEYTSPTVTVSGGTISASGENGTAIQAEDESFTVTVSGGTVSASGVGGVAINAYGASSTIAVSGGTVIADGESGTAIYTSGDVEVSGTAEVSANNSEGWAIEVESDSSTVTVNGGTVSAGGEYGCAIYAYGANSTVEVNGGTVSADGEYDTNYNNWGAIWVGGESSTVMVNSGTVSASGEYGCAICAEGESSTITVSGAAEVSAYGKLNVSNPDGGTIYAAGNVIIEDNAVVEATGESGRAINAYGNVEMSGGTVSAAWSAIYSNGENSAVMVSGGTVSAGGGFGMAVYVKNSGSTVTVSDDAAISADSPYGDAISANGNIEVSGGTVSAGGEYGCAIGTLGNVTVSGGTVASGIGGFALSANGNVEVSDGAVFGCGDGIDDFIYTSHPCGFTGVTGTGVVIAWNQSAGRTAYDEGLPTHLNLSSAGGTATAVWDVLGDEPGIAYQNGANAGFIHVGDVTVTALSATINGNEVSFDNSEKIATVSVPQSMSSIGTPDVSVAVSDGTTWRLYSDSACTHEAVLPYNLNVGANILYLKIDDSVSSAVYALTVTRAVPVTGITVTGGNAISVKGDTLQLTADVTPSDAANNGVTWSVVSGGAYATVSSSGLVTATADGTVTVRATAQDGTGIFGEIQIIISGQDGSSSSGGNSGSSSGNTTITPPVTVERQPNLPVTGAVAVTATAGAGGSSSAAIPDQSVIDAISKAQNDAKTQGKTANGISVTLGITAPQGTTALSATLSQTALKALADAGVISLEINGLPVSVSVDQMALRAIQSQSSGNVTITAVARQNLYGNAKTMIGTRPVYNITVSYGSDSTVTNLGGGTATVSIPYTPAQGEAAGYLYGVYVDGSGNATRIDGSAYDANSGCLIFSTGHLSIYGVGYTAPSAKLTDISGHWAKDAIDYVVGRGLLAGTPGTTFAPDAVMTRGMLVTALGRLADVDVKLYTTNSFTDVKAGSAFQPYIEWAYQKGIVQGIGNSQFAPDHTVTREEIAVILQNYAKATGYTLPVTRVTVTFADDGSIGSTYKMAVMAMQQAGIMLSENNNKFTPKANVTRVEVSAMLYRYIKLTIDPATAQGWAKNDSGQWMYFEDGKALTGWQTINGKIYCFDSSGGAYANGWQQNSKGEWFYLTADGSAARGWKDISGHRYYFGTDAVMIAGKWMEIDGKWYYFYADGSFARNATIDGYKIDGNGVKK